MKSLSFVLAKPKSSLSTKICLRTYKVGTEAPSKISIIDACLATCASQLFLPVVQSSGKPSGGQGREFLGAGLGASNPVREVIFEAHSLFSGSSGVAALVSLGVGHPGAITLDDPTAPSLLSRAAGWWGSHSRQEVAGNQLWLKTLINMANDCEETAREIKTQMYYLGVYWRFSVEQGLHKSAIDDDYEDLGEWIMTQTRQYLESDPVSLSLDACFDALKTRLSLTTLEQLRTCPFIL
jgi:hypothetical protein